MTEIWRLSEDRCHICGHARKQHTREHISKRYSIRSTTACTECSCVGFVEEETQP